MSFLFDACVLLGIVLVLAIALILVATDFQIRKMGWIGYPARLILFLINKSYRFGIWLRQNTREEIVVEDLPVGEYAVVCPIRVQTLEDLSKPVYDYKSMVDEKSKKRDRKTWIVLSKRPLPDDFKIVPNGRCNSLQKVNTKFVTSQKATAI